MSGIGFDLLQKQKFKRGVSHLIMLFIFCMFFPLIALADTAPGTSIDSAIKEARSVVLKEKGITETKELRSKLEKVIFPLFDFAEMARRSLGPSWRQASDSEKEEYVKLFTELISRTYYNRVIDNIGDSKIEIVKSAVRSKKALVKTSVSSKGDDFFVIYRMRNKNETWKIYDVIIENVSMVSNYRSEFGEIVRREKMAGLISKLRKKLN